MIINLTPFPAPRPRFSKFGTYNNPKYTKYKKDFLKLVSSKDSKFYEGALRLEVVFFMKIPQSLSKKKQLELEDQYHIKKPDTDNLIKTVKDSLEGTFYKNDSQICEIKAMKVYSKNPRVQINIIELNTK